MPFLDTALHALNFIAPALVVALLMAAFAKFWVRKSEIAPVFAQYFAINFVVCLAALGFGLWYFGSDGKMATYAGLVVGCAVCQAVLARRALK
jgi:hypothetical protein